MIIALLLAAVIWTHPAPVLWLCYPGKSPTSAAQTNCERIHYSILGRWRFA